MRKRKPQATRAYAGCARATAAAMTSLTVHLGRVLTLTASATTAQLLAAIADTEYDVVELAGGTYSALTYPISINGVDRTARPLTIRPASGATVIFTGATAPIRFGLTQYTAHITMEDIVFEACDFSATQDGIIATYWVDHVTLNRITVRSLGPFYAAAPRSWVLYVSSDLAHAGSNITANDWTVDCAYGANQRAWGGLAQGHAPAASNVTANGWDIQNAKYAIYAHGESGSAATNCNFDGWTIDDCGYDDGVPCSVYFADMTGTYSNLHATNCVGFPLYKEGSPQPTDGGGNTGLD